MADTNYTISEIAKSFTQVRSDPTLIQRAVLDTIENVSNGKMVIIDPNNPFVLNLEMSVSLAVSNLEEARNLTRKTYPALTDSWDDLYRHMSDYDYKDVYATPASGKFCLLLDKEELLSKMVLDPASLGTRRFTIPRYTQVEVQDTPFTLLYPIDIRLVSHGGLLISYNYTERSPIHILKTNKVDFDIVIIDGRETIRLFVDMIQTLIKRYVPKLNASSGFSRTYELIGKYYFCRAYIKNNVGVWTEIRTTHSNIVYDPNVPTVVLKVMTTGLYVSIPQIYASNGLITDSVRIDIYTTLGSISKNLSSLPESAYKTIWNRLDDENLDIFTSPILTLNRYNVYSPVNVDGGSNGISFEELRRRVITRSTSSEGVVITKAGLTARLNDMGYELVTNVDNITDRQFLASRQPPAPISNQVTGNISALIGTLQQTLTDLELSDSVMKNSRRHTIKPTQIYEMRDSRVHLVSNYLSNELWNLQGISPTELAQQLNTHKYLYSPFYYVIDSDINNFNCRVYHLDKPVISSRFFSDSNTSLGLNLSMLDYQLINSPNHDGYLLRVLLAVGDSIKQLGADFVDVQLSYKGRKDSNRYVIKGELISPIDALTGKPVEDNYLYEFHIQTRYDVDEEDGLIPVPYKSPINLEHEFDVVTIVKDYNPEGSIKGDIDELIDTSLIDGYSRDRGCLGVTHEKLLLKFGERLEHIWQRSRTVMQYDVFERYKNDIVDVYDSDVYEKDSSGNNIIVYNAESSRLLMNKLHSKGDIKYDAYGLPVLQHKAGDIIMDNSGAPIYKDGGRGIERHLDLLLLDARYLFSTKEEDVGYKDDVRDTIASWCTVDMVQINSELLERSEIFYYPMRTTGFVEVIADNNLKVSVEAEQRFNVTFWLRQDNYQNVLLRESIERITIDTISKTLKQPVISQDKLLDDLRLALSSSVVGIKLTGFTNDKYTTITLKDSSMGLAIAKKVRVMSNNQLEVVNDVNISFIVHGV